MKNLILTENQLRRMINRLVLLTESVTISDIATKASFSEDDVRIEEWEKVADALSQR